MASRPASQVRHFLPLPSSTSPPILVFGWCLVWGRVCCKQRVCRVAEKTLPHPHTRNLQTTAPTYRGFPFNRALSCCRGVAGAVLPPLCRCRLSLPVAQPHRTPLKVHVLTLPTFITHSAQHICRASPCRCRGGPVCLFCS